jgi:hypothetical protein
MDTIAHENPRWSKNTQKNEKGITSPFQLFFRCFSITRILYLHRVDEPCKIEVYSQKKLGNRHEKILAMSRLQ